MLSALCLPALPQEDLTGKKEAVFLSSSFFLHYITFYSFSFNLPPVHPSLQLLFFSLSPFAHLEKLLCWASVKCCSYYPLLLLCTIFPINISARQKLHSFSSIMHSDALLAERDTLSCAILQEHGDVSVFQLLLCLCFHYSCWELRSVDVQYTNVWTKTESSGELEGQHTCPLFRWEWKKCKNHSWIMWDDKRWYLNWKHIMTWAARGRSV